MKLKYKFLKAAFVLFMTIATISCDNETEAIGTTEQNNTTVYELIKNNSNISIFSKAIELTGLNTVLNTTDDFTIFAPNNATFEAYLVKNKFVNSLGYADVTLVPIETLKTVLQQHIIKGAKKKVIKLSGVKADYMVSGDDLACMANALDKDLYGIKIDIKDNELKVNDSDKAAAYVDVPASNGFVNVINNIISLTPLTPIINEISNTTPIPGDVITIKGDHFVSVTGVTFEGIPAKVNTNPNRNTLTVTCPVGFTLGKVVVTTKYGISNSVFIGELDFSSKDYLVFDETINNSWYNAGWASQREIVTTMAKKGLSSYRSQMKGWEGFGFAMWDTPLDATKYKSIKFSIYSETSGKVKLFLVKDKWDNGIEVTVSAGKWVTSIIDLDIDTMVGSSKKIDQFLFQESTGNSNVIFVDNAGFFVK